MKINLVTAAIALFVIGLMAIVGSRGYVNEADYHHGVQVGATSVK